VLLDIVFSVDSVITAVGLTSELWIIATAVVLSFMRPFILRGAHRRFHPAPSGPENSGALFSDHDRHHDFHGGYAQARAQGLYLSAHGVCALFVEILQMRYERNRQQAE
jgi:hypothetical protein